LSLLLRSAVLALFCTGCSGTSLGIDLVMPDRDSAGATEQILITASLPTLLIPVLVPLWARLFARHHVIAFRARLNWCFVGATAAFFAGAVSHWIALLWLGAILLGAGFAGGRLGWNLGHNDFTADDERATEYMGLHVTLTGVRGSIVPIVGVTLYEGFEAWAPGMGVWSLMLPFVLSLTGTIGFVLLARTLKAPPRGVETL